MNFTKKWVTLPLALSFLIVAVTGILLEFAFKSRELIAIHVWIGFVMVALSLCHLFKNQSAFCTYFKDKKIALGFLMLFSFILMAFYYPSQNSEQKVRIHPKTMTRVLTNAKIEALSSMINSSSEEMISSLESKGLRVNSKDETVKEIASSNQVEVEVVLGHLLVTKK